jgi:glucokinase
MPKKQEYYLGVDLGGTNMTVGLIDQSNKVVGRLKKPTRSFEGGDRVLERIVKTSQKLAEKHGLEMREIRGLGIGGPGAIDIDKGLVINAPNLGWKNFNVIDALSKPLGIPVAVDNDVNVAVYGEKVAGAARQYNDVFGFWMGTGVGGALVLNGKLYYGAFLTAGEIGHTILHPGAAWGRRTLENCASRTNIARLIVELVRANNPSIVTELVEGDYDRVRSRVIAKAVAAKDDVVCRVVREAAHFTGLAVANMVTVLSLPCVVLGGGLATELGDTWADWVRESFKQYVFPATLRSVRIVPTKLGDDAGIVGAGIIARERLGK